MSIATLQEDKLSLKTKLFYGIGDVGNAIVNSSIQFFLLIYYTDGALLPPALVGSALLLGKIWDAVNDPLLGWFSDRTTSKRFGKRRVFMIFGAIPLGISIMLLWFVPRGLSGLGIFLWVALTFIVFDTLWTFTNVPYYSLSSELTEDYDERSSLTSLRMTLAVPAYLVGAALTPAIVGLFASKYSGYGFIGVLYGVIASAALLISASGLREKADIAENISSLSVWKALKHSFQNKPFVRLMVAYLVMNLSFALIKTLMAYFLTYQLGMEKQVPLVMGLLLLVVALSLFGWKKLSEKWDKGPAYALGMAIGALAVGSSFFLPHSSTPLIYAIAVVAGVGFASNWVFPWSMIPDIVDFDRVETGEYRSGMYFGIWGVITKISEAIAIAGSGWLLALFGYIPNIEQSADTLFGIRLFFGPLPALFILLVLPLLIWHPINRKTHLSVRMRLRAKQVEEYQDANA
ncbi:MAG: MFS transporter [Anaerolineae bacterium]|nr:MFS transporter [Anaerolineae bacterium]